MMHQLSRRVARSMPRLTKSFMPGTQTTVRHLNLHEYQSKDLMEQYGLNVQKGKMAENATEAAEIAKWIKDENPSAELILKAQIHAGGRGKGSFDSGLKGGVKICSTPDEVADYTKQMLGYKLITHQTGPEGQLCEKVLINEGITIDSEKYVAILMDRAANGPVIVASAKGGMDIEAVAEEDPDAIVSAPIDPRGPLPKETSKAIAEGIGFAPEKIPLVQEQLENLYELFLSTDATQVEINPFAEGSVPGTLLSCSGLVKRVGFVSPQSFVV